MAKPAGAACDLNCEHCFFLSKEMPYPGSRFRMAQDLQRPVSASYSRATRGPRVVVTWQGCEPTMMGLDYFGGVLWLSRDEPCSLGSRSAGRDD